VYRDFLFHEAKLEAKKHELLFMNTIASSFLTEETQRRAWDKQVKTSFDQYVGLLLGIEVLPVSSEEIEMKEYYDKVIKDSKPVLKKDKNKKLSVEGLPKL
jgi:hypothetical protein